MAATDTQQAPLKLNSPDSPQPGARRILLPVIMIAVLAAAGLIIWKVFFSRPQLPENIVALSGRIEGDDSAVSPKTSGRILEIHFREGDVVKAGDMIARLDDQQVRAREEQAQAAVLQAQAQLRSARQQSPYLTNSCRDPVADGQSKTDAEGTRASGRSGTCGSGSGAGAAAVVFASSRFLTKTLTRGWLKRGGFGAAGQAGGDNSRDAAGVWRRRSAKWKPRGAR